MHVNIGILHDAHVKELNQLREALSHDIACKKHKLFVSQHAFREFEADRLMRLDRCFFLALSSLDVRLYDSTDANLGV